MVQRDPLGLTDMVQRDADRLSRAFGNGGPPRLPGLNGGNGLRLPGLPALPVNTNNGREPQTPPELIADLPNQVNQTVQTGLDLATKAPGQVAEDLTKAVNNLLQVPRNLLQELFITPGKLAGRLSPENINMALETVRDSADFGGSDPQDRRARMRTITDVIDLFTPT